MKLIWFISYNFIFYPLIFVIGSILSLFNSKFRQGVVGRFRSQSELKKFFKSISTTTDIYWFHAASLGEFYQVKPVLEGLKNVEPECVAVVSFSSPSGYDNAKSDDIDLRIYMPFDFLWSVRRALKITRPKKVIFASYDIWPNMVWIAEKRNIHTNIFAARLKEGSLKLKSGFFSFHKSVYQSISTIYTVAEKDYKNMQLIIGDSNIPVLRALGNPRYDMVMKTADEFTKEHQLSVLSRNNRIIIGSSHKEDDEFLIPVLSKMMNTHPDLKILYAPHEPSKSEIKRIQSAFSEFGLESSVFGRKKTLELPEDNVVVLSVVGVLSKLYWQGKISYVGGGFSTGIHNVMEPAIARLPVIFGPNYHHAHEAEELLDNGGGFCIQKKDEFQSVLERLVTDEDHFLKASYAATNVIHQNLGSSTRIIRSLIRD